MKYAWFTDLIFLCHLICGINTNNQTKCVVRDEENLNELKVGYLVSWSSSAVKGYRYAGAITKAIDDINNDPNILNGTTLKFQWGNSGCGYTKGIGAAVDLYNKKVIAYFGPACSKACLAAGYLSTAKKIPMISYSCSSIELANKGLYPYFARLKPFARGSSKWTPMSLVALIKQFNWTQVCVVRRMDALLFRIGERTEKELKENNIKVIGREVYYEQDNNFKKRGDIIVKLKDKCRIFVLISMRKEVTEIMLHAYHMGLTKEPKYAFLAVDYRHHIKLTTTLQGWNKELGSNYTFDMVQNMINGLISVNVQYPNETSPEYLKFAEDVVKRVQQDPFNDTRILGTKTINIAAYLYDATMLYARAIDRLLRNGENIRSAALVVKELKEITFEGLTGHVKLDDNLSRIPIFNMLNFNNGEKRIMGYFDALKNTTVKLDNQFYFPGGTMKVPMDVPKCGFIGEFCKDDVEEFNYILLVILAPFIVSLVIVAIVYTYNKKKYELRMMSKGLIINVNDISFGDDMANASVRSKMSAMNFGTNLSKRLGSSFAYARYFPSSTAQVVSYKSNRVFLKTYKNIKLDMSWELLHELKQIKDINHINVNLFFGVAPQGSSMHIAWSYCSKGSLQDVLQNDDLDIDWMFRLSFANDIIKGLMEIHRSCVSVHGNLTSSNCLVDNRWVCKLSNFGMHMFHTKRDDENNLPLLKRDLWKAPEKLSDKTFEHTKEADIYSYAMLMYEIQTREDIFGIELRDKEMSVQEIVNVMKAGGEGPFRPMLTDTSDVPTGYLELMQRCWDDFPENRPHIKEVGKIITKLQRDSTKGGSLVDHMLLMMEKYTDNLEDIVAERTRQLEEEKDKTETLLYKMLPKSVANRLKEGQPVMAEDFDAVTIFFSDIVGFTSLCAESSPLEVVELLNDLYCCFDNCVDKFDVYKVETIGDAYMVVSGLPIPNGDKHAGEIASMSLDLLSEVKVFKISHRPGMQMQLRIGMHTGSCVAGVVGVKMPRYCLFGDTVNYASRMESSGLALRIHVSPESKEILDSLGGYHLVERGPVQMKGKGSVVTFFLSGKDGFDKSLPDLIRAASYEEHSFK